MNPRFLFPDEDERHEDMDMDLSRFDWGSIAQYKEVLAIVVSVAVLILLTIWRTIADGRGHRRLANKLDQGQADQAQRFDWLADNVDTQIETLRDSVMTSVKSTEHRVMALERRQDIQDQRLDLLKQQNDLNRQMAEFNRAKREDTRLMLAEATDCLNRLADPAAETQRMPKMDFTDTVDDIGVEPYTAEMWAQDFFKGAETISIWKWGFGHVVMIKQPEEDVVCDVALFVTSLNGGEGFTTMNAVATEVGVGVETAEELGCGYQEEDVEALAELLGQKIKAGHFGQDFENWSPSVTGYELALTTKVVRSVCETIGMKT